LSDLTADNSPCHAHIYYTGDERHVAEALRDRCVRLKGTDEQPRILFVGPLRDGPVGPHPLPQFEVHFPVSSRAAMIAAIEESGLRALVHPLTDDDLADHTRLAHWIGEPLELDLSVLDPRGANKGVVRYGKTDF
jgi:aromatic ring-cleaving dioxygenase